MSTFTSFVTKDLSLDDQLHHCSSMICLPETQGREKIALNEWPFMATELAGANVRFWAMADVLVSPKC